MDELYLLKKEALRRGLSHRTVVTYCQCVKQFMRKCRKEFLKVGKKDITDYIDSLVERGACGNTLNVHINALRFLFQEVFGRRIMFRVRYSKTPKTLPVFLTKNEVIRLFEAVINPKHRLILELIYSAGLRVGEVIRLKKQDLEFERGIGWVRRGKGAKNRPFIIARLLVPKLKLRVEANCKFGSYLFVGRKNSHISVRSVQEIVKHAAVQAGIKKNVHPHTLRHSFATHLVENGYEVCAVQPLLGHNSAETTMVYVHMARPALLGVKSPYDSLAFS
ncbi:tyrosine-type recombinase/integrase [Candidatus Woesearchaeota archaeon]|nr:tyrosine-type recombinase/integrase [Candidatus Woesearchaeota archaeon]